MLVVAFVVVPLVELYVLAQVSHAIGLGPALAVLLTVSVLGAWLVKRQGLGVLRNVRRELEAHRMPTEHLAEGALVLLCGALLVVPGFVTDAVGALLLVPAVRRRAATHLGDRFARPGTRWGRRITATYGTANATYGTARYGSAGHVIEARASASDGAGSATPAGALDEPTGSGNGQR